LTTGGAAWSRERAKVSGCEVFMTATVDEQATTTVRGACPHDCPDTCAMLVSVRDGRAVQVRGDPGHPFTRGGLCVKVNNYVDEVYSPDRVLTWRLPRPGGI
jgi:anaerobic selenocysteine-containing dehydrogenase